MSLLRKLAGFCLLLVGGLAIGIGAILLLLVVLVAAGGWVVVSDGVAPLRVAVITIVLAFCSLLLGALLMHLGSLLKAPMVRRGYCRKCGYNLTGVEGERCPECGAWR